MANIINDTSLNLSIKKANIGGVHLRFTSLVNADLKIIIQEGIAKDEENESLLGKFAFSLFCSDKTYFMNKDMEMTFDGMGRFKEPIKDIGLTHYYL